MSEAYVANPTSEILARILILPKLGLSSKLGAKSAPKAIRLMRALQDLTVSSLSASYCLARAPPLPREELAAKLIDKGNLGKAFRRLSTNDSVPAVTPAVIAELEKLQCPPRAPYQTGLGPPPLRVTPDMLKETLLIMNSSSAAGLSGWSAALLRICYFRQFMMLLLNSILAGDLPSGIASELLLASSLFPLRKPSGKLRPIAIGEIFYRLAAKIAVRYGSVPGDLLPSQFGVGSVLGVEPVIHLIEKHLEDKDSVVLSEDLVNAYNTMPREEIYRELLAMGSPLVRFFLLTYGRASRLVVSCQGGDITVQFSAEGVRQGDPVAGLFFSYGMKCAMVSLSRRLKSVNKAA